MNIDKTGYSRRPNDSWFPSVRKGCARGRLGLSMGVGETLAVYAYMLNVMALLLDWLKFFQIMPPGIYKQYWMIIAGKKARRISYLSLE